MAVVQTVLGDVNPSNLGITMTHEHLWMEFSQLYQAPPQHLSEKFLKPLTFSKLGYLRQYPYSEPGNLMLNDAEANSAVLNDVIEYKRSGGGTIVENSTEGLKRNVDFYKEVSLKSGVHVVGGTGHYIEDMQLTSTRGLQIEDIYDHMKRELTEGFVDCPSSKAGFMGEIASVWPIRDFERRAIQAVGELQPEVGCGVSFHPHRDPAAPFEIIRLYLEAGGRADQAVMSHLDRTLLEDDQLLSFSELGTYCQFDLFGVEVSYYQLHRPTVMPSDGQRIKKLQLLIKNGKLDRLLMSHDIHTKHRLIDFGGHGYSHIINNVLPIMVERGVSREDVDTITVKNPAKWLTIDKK